MVSIIYKKYGLKINAVWFFDDSCDDINHSRADIIFLHGVNTNEFKNSIIESQLTLLTDLTQASEDLFELINNKVRREINHSIKDGVVCEVIKVDEIRKNPVILNTFKQEYDEFTRLKGIRNTYNERAMEQYVENGNVILTKAFLDKTNCVQHIWLCDGKNARGLYSVSNFRLEGSDQNMIGRANKYLHWYEMQYLQDNQYQTYDWGGVFSVTNPNGIDNFKLKFGGREHQYYNVFIGNSMVGRTVIKVCKAYRASKKRGRALLDYPDLRREINRQHS